MNKITLFIILFICSCGNHEILPSSTGSNNEIIIVSSLDIWNSGKSNVIRQKFSADIIGINQSEPMFNLIPIQPKNFKSIFKTHKHIILLSNEGDCLVQKNKWAKEQLVCQINIQLEKDKLEGEVSKIVSLFINNELKNIQKKISKSPNKEIAEVIKKQFNIDLLIPSEYTIVKDSSNFIWISYNPSQKEEIKHMFFYTLNHLDSNYSAQALAETSRLFARYLKGPSNSFVVIEKDFPTYCKDSYCRGLWRLSEGFMGGPFLQKVTKQENGIIFVKVGLVFAPQDSKRQYIKQLEASFQ